MPSETFRSLFKVPEVSDARGTPLGRVKQITVLDGYNSGIHYAILEDRDSQIDVHSLKADTGALVFWFCKEMPTVGNILLSLAHRAETGSLSDTESIT